MESLVVRTSLGGAGYTFNSVGGTYRDGVARPLERNTRCQWFLTAMPFKGCLRIVNQVPIDKYKSKKILRLLEFMDTMLIIPFGKHQ